MPNFEARRDLRQCVLLWKAAIILSGLKDTSKLRLSPCVLVQPDGWARGEREGYGEPCDVTSLSLSHTVGVLEAAISTKTSR